MSDETQGAPAPDSTGPAVAGVDAWSAAPVSAGVDTANAATLATNCLLDGYAQGHDAAALAVAQAPEPAPHSESLFERLEDDVVWAAEEAAYHASNLVASARGRKPDDGIDAWRKRTGGLRGAGHVA